MAAGAAAAVVSHASFTHPSERLREAAPRPPVLKGPKMQDAIQKFVELETRRRELKDQLKAVEAEQEVVREQLLAEFERAGVSSLSAGPYTVYLHRQLWAVPEDRDYEKACQALREAGLGDFVHERFNVHQLSAYFRELANETGEVELPAPLQGVIRVEERVDLRARKR